MNALDDLFKNAGFDMRYNYIDELCAAFLIKDAEKKLEKIVGLIDVEVKKLSIPNTSERRHTEIVADLLSDYTKLAFESAVNIRELLDGGIGTHEDDVNFEVFAYQVNKISRKAVDAGLVKKTGAARTNRLKPKNFTQQTSLFFGDKK